jgi:hypothetical protein
MSSPATPGPIPIPENEQKPARAARKSKPQRAKTTAKSKPTKTLPNWRIGVAKQFDILRAYGAASQKGTKPVSTEDAASIVKMSPLTVVMANAFLTSVGLLKRTDAGSFLPCQEVLDFLGAYEWDKKTASFKLAPKFKQTWFAEALLPRIQFGDPIEEKSAITILAESAGNVGPEYERELRMLLDFLALSGAIQKDGGQIKQIGKAAAMAPETLQVRAEETVTVNESVRASRVSTGYAAQSPGGGVDFNINVQVDMAEFGGWHPDRITAFFKGIALVLAAKAGIEKEGTGS